MEKTWTRRIPVLEPEQVEEGRWLREHKGMSKRALAAYLSQKYAKPVSPTAIWENILSDRKLENLHRYNRSNFNIRIRLRWPRCSECTILITREIKDRAVPLNFQVGEHCVECYLRKYGLKYLDLLNV